MNWSALMVLALAGPVPTMDVAHTTHNNSFESYTQAWNAAHEAERPMLLILNPAEGDKISEDELRDDEALQPLMDNYVVAVVDTGTEHGKQVHKLFDSAPLPRVVVIDKEQKKQIYRTSSKLSHDSLANVLERYKDGAPQRYTLKMAQPAGSCPNCQRNWLQSTY